MTYVPAIRFLLPLIVAVAGPGGAAVDQPAALGRYGDWLAASHSEAGQMVCYAFTFAVGDTAAAGRGAVVLSVAQRPGGRNSVAVDLGWPVRRDAAFALDVQGVGYDFYVARRDAFARDGAAVVAAMSKAEAAGDPAADRGAGPRGARMADRFSLAGFTGALAAIDHACPEG